METKTLENGDVVITKTSTFINPATKQMTETITKTRISKVNFTNVTIENIVAKVDEVNKMVADLQDLGLIETPKE